MSNKKRRIGRVSGSLLIAVAVLVDVLQTLIGLTGFIPLIGFPLALLGTMTLSFSAILLFGFWFSALGICVLREYPLAFMGGSMFEQIPGLNIIPCWWWTVSRIVWQEWLTVDEGE